MINEQIISIDNTTNGTTIDAFAPFTMVLSTSAYTAPNKIWSINYDFGDGNLIQNNLKLTPYLYGYDLPISDEPGDPRNYPVQNTYYLEDVVEKSYNIVISVYTIGVTNPRTIKFKVNLHLPTTAEIFGTNNSLKLVGSRMFGLENQLIYLLESQNPNYLLPVLARF